jgi:hypothetical protein
MRPKTRAPQPKRRSLMGPFDKLRAPLEWALRQTQGAGGAGVVDYLLRGEQVLGAGGRVRKGERCLFYLLIGCSQAALVLP